ncbi:hypothetical protein PFISCL1PPCAC_5461, partial [Pristionchus fissidentatus]
MSPTRFPRRHEIMREVPENRKEAAQALEGRYGADLIAAEMRLQREREDELRRSRSQLGLPDLQDTLQLWRQGYRGLSTNCLASATSFDHGLNHDFGHMSKAQSITELSQARGRPSTNNPTTVSIVNDAHLDEQVEAYKSYVEGFQRLNDSLALYQSKPLTIVRDKQSSQMIISTDAAGYAPKLSKLASEALNTVGNVHREWTSHELQHYAKSKPILANYTTWMREQGMAGIQEIKTMHMARNQFDAATIAHAKKANPEKKKKLDQTKERYESIRNKLVNDKFNAMEKTFDEHRDVCVEMFKEMKHFHNAMVVSSEHPFTALLSKLDEAAKANASKQPTQSEEKIEPTRVDYKAVRPDGNCRPVIRKLSEMPKDDGQYECLDNM